MRTAQLFACMCVALGSAAGCGISDLKVSEAPGAERIDFTSSGASGKSAADGGAGSKSGARAGGGPVRTEQVAGGGAGGRGGSTGSGGTSHSSAGMTAAPALTCGTATCPAPPRIAAPDSGVPIPRACCLDQSASTCGITNSASTVCEARAVADPRCPAFQLIPNSSTVPCCINNACGQDGSGVGRGCIENSVFSRQFPSGTTTPPSRACDAAADAGVVDGGT